jgi:hypothetical protein
MFSREGAERNLRTLNPSWTGAQLNRVLETLDRHRHEVLDAIRPRDGDVLIAVHNNSEGYSVRDELSISNRVAMNDESNPHEFCLCTDGQDFARLARGPYNVILQNRMSPPDDGSLSRCAAREGFRYVNIETGLGKYDKQRAILEWVDSALPRA